ETPRRRAGAGLGEWVASLDAVEPPEVAVAGVDNADAMLAHECSQVRVGHVVATGMVAGHAQVDVPEAVLFARRPHVRARQELSDIVSGLGRIPVWVTMRRYPISVGQKRYTSSGPAASRSISARAVPCAGSAAFEA